MPTACPESPAWSPLPLPLPITLQFCAEYWQNFLETVFTTKHSSIRTSLYKIYRIKQCLMCRQPFFGTQTDAYTHTNTYTGSSNGQLCLTYENRKMVEKRVLVRFGPYPIPVFTSTIIFLHSADEEWGHMAWAEQAAKPTPLSPASPMSWR